MINTATLGENLQNVFFLFHRYKSNLLAKRELFKFHFVFPSKKMILFAAAGGHCSQHFTSRILLMQGQLRDAPGEES